MKSRRLVQRLRGSMVSVATRLAPARRAMRTAGRELTRAAQVGSVIAEARAAAKDDLYGGAYFGEGRDPSGDRHGHSGYASYDRVSSNADIAAYLLWRNFRAQRTLDVGCAKGFVVEALRELGVDAQGCDVSAFAVEHATPGALGFVRLGNLSSGLPYADAEFDVVSTLEILEHLEPSSVPVALGELRRVCGGIVWATIPSFGPNAGGPDGHYEGKIRPDRLAYYEGLGDGFTGPVPFEDLAVDVDGDPVEGHLTIASYEWWTARFADAGFTRLTEVERRLHADLESTGLSEFWNLYVFAVAEASPYLSAPRAPEKSLRQLGLVHPLIEHGEAQRAAAGAPATER